MRDCTRYASAHRLIRLLQSLTSDLRQRQFICCLSLSQEEAYWREIRWYHQRSGISTLLPRSTRDSLPGSATSHPLPNTTFARLLNETIAAKDWLTGGTSHCR